MGELTSSGLVSHLQRCSVVLAALTLTLNIGLPKAAHALTCQQGPFIIFFEKDFAFVDAEARQILDHAVSSAGNCGYAKTTILGHIDTSETEGLDMKRARTVEAYLTARGFPAEDVEVVGAGSSTFRVPTGPNVSEKQNRRVEITFGPWDAPTI